MALKRIQKVRNGPNLRRLRRPKHRGLGGTPRLQRSDGHSGAQRGGMTLVPEGGGTAASATLKGTGACAGRVGSRGRCHASGSRARSAW